MDAKGQGFLKEIGAWERVEPHCAEVVGRVDWMPGGDKPQEVDFIEKFGYPIKVIQRDCLTALLREEIENKYADKIKLLYSTECTSITWGNRPGEPVRLQFQRTRRITPAGEVPGARPTVESVGAPLIVDADFVVGADGANSRIRDAMESDTGAEEVRIVPGFCHRVSVCLPAGIALAALAASSTLMLAVVLYSGLQSGALPGPEQACFQDHRPQGAAGLQNERRLQRRLTRGHHHRRPTAQGNNQLPPNTPPPSPSPLFPFRGLLYMCTARPICRDFLCADKGSCRWLWRVLACVWVCQDGKMIGVVLFRPDDRMVTEAKTAEQVKELFAAHLPMFLPFIDDQA